MQNNLASVYCRARPYRIIAACIATPCRILPGLDQPPVFPPVHLAMPHAATTPTASHRPAPRSRPGLLGAGAWPMALLALMVPVAQASASPALSDPLQVNALQPPRLGLWLPEDQLACANRPVNPAGSSRQRHYPADAAPPGLAEVLERSLCQHPQTMQAWALARAQVAQLGVVQGAFLPTVQANLSTAGQLARQGSKQNNAHQASAGASLGWLIADGGARSAALEEARQLLAAAAATQNQTVLTLFFTAVQTYYQAQAAQATLLARREAETASQAALAVSTARHLAGSATPADRLQAQTAYSQARLLRLRAEGELRIAWGNLASQIGESPDYFDAWASRWLHPSASPSFDTLPGFAAASGADDPDRTESRASANITALLATALQHRPDLAVANAQWQAATANIAAAQASQRPSVSLSVGTQWGDSSGLTQGSASLGLTAVFPLFSGHVPAYRIAAASAQAEARAAQVESLQRKIGEEVWRAHLNLETALQAQQASADLLSSAQASAEVAMGRYRAGVGTLLDLLNAQSALASARQQRVSTTLDWQLARSQLAQSLGQFDPRLLDPSRSAPPLTLRPESSAP